MFLRNRLGVLSIALTVFVFSAKSSFGGDSFLGGWVGDAELGLSSTTTTPGARNATASLDDVGGLTEEGFLSAEASVIARSSGVSLSQPSLRAPHGNNNNLDTAAETQEEEVLTEAGMNRFVEEQLVLVRSGAVQAIEQLEGLLLTLAQQNRTHLIGRIYEVLDSMLRHHVFNAQAQSLLLRIAGLGTQAIEVSVLAALSVFEYGTIDAKSGAAEILLMLVQHGNTHRVMGNVNGVAAYHLRHGNEADKAQAQGLLLCIANSQSQTNPSRFMAASYLFGDGTPDAQAQAVRILLMFVQQKQYDPGMDNLIYEACEMLKNGCAQAQVLLFGLAELGNELAMDILKARGLWN